MANAVYENEVLESKLTNLLNTKMATRNFMKIDNDLAENAGMKKVINVYSYSGTVEEVEMGDGNTVTGEITFSPVEYAVAVSQQNFSYFDEQAMQDPKVVDFGLAGATTVMVNDMNTKFFAELAKATLEQEYAAGGAITYDTVVDGISLMELEDESNLFIVIGTDLKADIRKDVDFKSSLLGEMLYTGQIGTISGIPVVVSKLVPTGAAYIASKEAVTLFTKVDSEVEQERDADLRKNDVYMRKVNLVALTDATKVVKIIEGA
jgi:hypothetical protein